MEAPVFFDGIKDDRGKTLTGAEITIVLFPNSTEQRRSLAAAWSFCRARRLRLVGCRRGWGAEVGERSVGSSS